MQAGLNIHRWELISMATYTPDRWIVVELTHKGEKIRKVFAGWYGGYCGSDSWKLSSETIKTIDHGEYYEFQQHSGSVYICYKGAEGVSMYMESIFCNWADQNNAETYIEKVNV